MARIDVHRGDPGWLVDVQSELTWQLPTRVVVPLLPVAKTPTATELNPVFTIEDARYAFMAELLAAVPRRSLAAFAIPSRMSATPSPAPWTSSSPVSD